MLILKHWIQDFFYGTLLCKCFPKPWKSWIFVFRIFWHLGLSGTWLLAGKQGEGLAMRFYKVGIMSKKRMKSTDLEEEDQYWPACCSTSLTRYCEMFIKIYSHSLSTGSLNFLDVNPFPWSLLTACTILSQPKLINFEEYVNLYEVWKLHGGANIPLEEVGRGGGGLAAKSPNIGSDPASPPPPNISTNEIPRYTQLLLTQRSAPLTLNSFFGMWSRFWIFAICWDLDILMLGTYQWSYNQGKTIW